ncbi:MAG: aldehyde ferredoxin oxidoreductase C-terminal domain-containing protein [Deinococcales bacterium]
MARYGTRGVVMPEQSSGGLPSFNWNSGVIGDLSAAESLSGEKLYDDILRGAATDERIKKARDTCYALCVVNVLLNLSGKAMRLNPNMAFEYETIATFGSYCGVTDLHAVVYANQLCNAYGVDTISCGATIAWAMECFEAGLIGLEDTGNIDLRFGNAEAMIAMLERPLNGKVLAIF